MKTMNKTLISFGTLLLFLLASAQPVNADADVTPGNVTSVAFNFTPNVQFADGDNFTFHNEDLVPHHPKADDGCFDAGQMGSGAEKTVSLGSCDSDGDGEVEYHCEIHGFMTATIQV